MKESYFTTILRIADAKEKGQEFISVSFLLKKRGV